MNAAITQRPPASLSPGPQPNELDLRRIERLLEQRCRYRYVTPAVTACPNGYLIDSPCCSRNTDPFGGRIDIAKLEYDPGLEVWKLYSKDHAKERWQFHLLDQRLSVLMASLNRDAGRLFWP